ncbi:MULTISPECIES: XrtA-associated tyrosine autokinase [Methylomonas]|uniref:non-specific protein-tyrosine kinase n=1 Tax=Methylomonas koyamae TaxID=702114 RepID=A0A177PFT8_9GAMM|nr:MULTISPECIES: XrtA-associated tyrosine autokinase [Methylomonas]OAI29227.1 protein tyrosine kinase [Methylomonas koyamae]WGS85541.1 XrtA-associated tyrosine autokinase [Methylomonas sp. UP202]
MSIIENALKKAGKQGLVLDDDQVLPKGSASSPAIVINSEELALAESVNGQFSERQVNLDWKGLAEKGYIDNNDAKSQLAEEFRVIKRPLVNNVQGGDGNGISRPNLILICSSLPSEGKTFISINLALSLANERDKKVLLIDADVEKPSIAKELGVQSPLGLIEYLEDDRITFSDILLKTDLPNLSLITAGKRHKYSTELLSSQRMYLFAEEISRRYKDRIVIFDSPPLLVATQAQILAELVGQVVLVIAAEITPQSVVNEAVSKLSNCDVVMTLLNKTRREIDIYGHNYSYGKYGQQ